MVDFKRLAEESYNRSTPEERARIDAWRERENRYDATLGTLEATFTRYAERRTSLPGQRTPDYALVEDAVWTKPITVRIEDRSVKDDRGSEIIRFIGGPTGHEAFTLSAELVETLRDRDPSSEDDFWICAGSARYDGCRVSAEAVLDYIAEFRPELAPDLHAVRSAAPRP
jgi:hypothetical protein